MTLFKITVRTASNSIPITTTRWAFYASSMDALVDNLTIDGHVEVQVCHG